MVGDKYVPQLASLDEGFPAALPVPALLREFAGWLAGQPRSSLGWFHLESEPLDAKFAGDDDATFLLRERLALFMLFPDGARLALWKPDAEPPAVVRLGSRGERDLVAPDLETFLIALAHGATGVRELEREQRETPAARAELARWLSERGVRASGRAIAPDAFRQWFDATVESARAAGVASSRAPLRAAKLPRDLFEQVDPLIGSLIDDPRVRSFFESIGIDLRTIRDPAALRALARPSDGVELEIAWPWDRGSEWLEAEYPKAQRKQLELRRARMFWSLTLFVARETRPGQTQTFQPYAGALPLGIRRDDDATSLEHTLGPPVRGSEGTRIWDFPERRRALIGGFNEGPFARTDLPRGGLKWLTWRYGQSRS
jgi:hypothetical protein